MGKSKELAELGQVVTQSGGNVGIGASVPEYALHLKGSYPYIAFEDTDSGSTSQHTITGNSDGNMYFDSVINNASGNSGFRFRHNSASITSLAIDASGRVTMPYQPSFYATCRGSGRPNGVSGDITYGNVKSNVGGHYNNGNGRFTAPISGNYFFTATILNQNSGAAQLWLLKNGSYFSSGIYLQHYDSTGSVQAIVQMTAGDWVNAYTNQIHYEVDYGDFAGHLIG